MWKAQWESGNERKGALSSELDALLDNLHSKCEHCRPMLVAVESSNGDTLTIGVGSELSVLSFVPGSGEPPYLSSVGDRQEQGVKVFYYMGEWTEIPKRKLIPYALARQAMRSFVDSGRLTDDIRWEED